MKHKNKVKCHDVLGWKVQDTNYKFSFLLTLCVSYVVADIFVLSPKTKVNPPFYVGHESLALHVWHNTVCWSHQGADWTINMDLSIPSRTTLLVSHVSLHGGDYGGYARIRRTATSPFASGKYPGQNNYINAPWGLWVSLL